MQKNVLKLIIILCMLVAFSPSTIFAAPPAGGYEPGETLDPNCAPGDTDCIVTPLLAQDEGVDLSGNVLKLNFEGAGVSSAIASGVVTVTISGGGSSPIALGSSGNTLYTPGLGAGEGNLVGGHNIFLGTSAGAGATGVFNSNFIGQQAGQGADSVSNSNFLGGQAGQGATGASQSNFFGNGAGFNASNASQSNFLGASAGGSATTAFQSNFFGNSAGNGATNASQSNFLGAGAGVAATNASNSNFLGLASGQFATNASNSNFLGDRAGYSATNAANSLFIGYQAGNNDIVDNVTIPGTSILIGDNTSTGGYSNSIGLGAGAINTSANQLLLGSDYIFLSLRGINYELPSTGGSSGDVLTTSSAGELSWTTLAESAWITSGSNIYTDPNRGNMSIGINTDTPNANLDLRTSGPAGQITAKLGYNDTLNNLSYGVFGSSDGGSLSTGLGVYDDNLGFGYGVYSSDVNALNYFAGRTGIGINTPDSSSILDLTSTTLGLLMPRMTEAERDLIGTPATGLMVYNTDTNAFNYYNGSVWGAIGGGSSLIGFTSSDDSETWFGQGAGDGDASTNGTVFVGIGAGQNATDASQSTFIGNFAGNNATNALRSNFIGVDAGSAATNAFESIFIGSAAGVSATNAANSIFIGRSSGINDTVDNTISGNSILIGDTTSTGGFSNSIALGTNATNTSANQLLLEDDYIYLSLRGVNYELPSADGASGNVLTTDGAGVLSWEVAGGPITLGSSGNTLYTLGLGAGEGNVVGGNNIFFGSSAGDGATGASQSNFFGIQAGFNATNASTSNFIGSNAGQGATNAATSNFIGNQAGFDATGAQQSNFIGFHAGNGATGASTSNFFGTGAGRNATGASNSNFLGNSAGFNATNASNSNFLGRNAGNGATNASKSIFIGENSGQNDTVNNTVSGSSILIGRNTSTGGFSNSIAFGESATNTSANQLMIGSATSPIDSTRINGSASTQCTITTGTGIACTSDERLKDNIEDLQNGTLEKLVGLRAVTYTWAQDENSTEQVGFLAQQLESLFPQLVATDADGYKSVFYSQITPILTKAIQELHAIVTDFIEDMRQRVQTEELCLGETCITETELQQLLEMREQNNTSGISDVEDEIQEEVVSEEDSQEEIILEEGIDTEQEEPISVDESVTTEEGENL